MAAALLPDRLWDLVEPFNDKRADIHEAFLSLGCSLICWQSVRRT
jgi:hypothetical protein